ncbi:hypothetical protein HMPREF1051_0231 [Neisseria sicca VK64]|uniref:Uncharacterized protein n=1 Tax=Neisseria sicca VK64 TaxID=1095748 RepID=I2NWQ9_NEISI|nr:hypothetical protein HMPREF1051_0231 [Neisseria sicca VK64]
MQSLSDKRIKEMTERSNKRSSETFQTTFTTFNEVLNDC